MNVVHFLFIRLLMKYYACRDYESVASVFETRAKKKAKFQELNIFTFCISTMNIIRE